jgi:hypothetical protein
MRPSQLTMKLLAGAGIGAGSLLGWAAAAAATPPSPPAAATPAAATSQSQAPAGPQRPLAPNPPSKQPTITSAPASPGTDTTPTWTFTNPNRSGTTTCELLQGSSVVFSPVACSGSATYDLAGHAYTTYTFVVTATVGNSTGTASSSYTFLPPAPAITGAPTGPGNDTTPTWSFTTPSGTSDQCSLLSGSIVVGGPVACSGSQTFPVSTDGTYTFSVVAVAPTGFRSAPATSSYTLDTTPPPAPVITSAPPSLSTDDTPTWTFTATGATGATCTITSGLTTVVGPAACSSPATFDLTAEPDGTYTLSVTAHDALGNVSPAATSTYTLQRIIPPPSPTITAAPASPGNDSTPTWSFTTPTGSADQCSLLNGSTVVAGPVACSGSQTFTVSTDGTYTFSVVAVDTATNARSVAATSTYTYDHTPPSAPVFTARPSSPSTNATPSWSFTTPATAASLECTLRLGTTVIAGPTACSGTFTTNLKNRPDGTYTLSVVALDALGNRSTPATAAYTLDRTPPAPPTITGGPASPTNDSTPTWTVTPPAGAVATTCTITSSKGTVLGPVPCSGAFTAVLTSVADGTYTLATVAKDAAGNVSAPASTTFTLDRTPPPTPTITGGPASVSSDTTPSWSFKAPGANTVLCSVLAGAAQVVAPVGCSSPASFDLSKLPDGTYTFSVVSLDAAGNRSAPATRSYSLRAARGTPAPAPNPTPPPSPAPDSTPPPGTSPAPAPPPNSTSSPTPGSTPSPGPGRNGTPAPNSGPAPSTTPTTLPSITLTPPTTAPPPVERIIQTAGRVATDVSSKAAFPLVLLALVILFLAIQDQIDRRDPKLAEAPLHAGDSLEFGPPPTRRGTT